MSYTFPDVSRALLEVIGPTATLWLSDLEGTINHLYSAGGNVWGPLRSDRVVINTYDSGRSAAKEEAERVMQVLTSGPHETEHGLLDHIHPEVIPHSVSFTSDTISLFQATYRVDTRPL